MHRSARFLGLALVSAVIAGAVGAVVGSRLDGRPIAVLRGQVEGLQTALAQQSKARDSLALEVGRLRAQIDSMEARLGMGVTPVPAKAEAAPAASGAARSASAGIDPQLLPHALVGPDELGSARGIDLDALQAGGFSEGEAERLRERWETSEMERLYLRDRATREGWLATPRYAEEIRALSARSDGLRDELGEDRYDWFLYASGQFNRVLVADVLAGSPAREAGLQRGDALLRYGEARVFEPNALQRETTLGTAGESVRVEVQRGGERRVVVLPRGPIGVRTYVDRVRPEPQR